MENKLPPEIDEYIAIYGALAVTGFVVAALLCFWLFTTLSIRFACWFTLIEAKLSQCFRLTLSLCLTKISLALIIFIFYMLHPPSILISAILVLCVGCFYILRSVTQTFACKKRSAITILVMSSFSADLILAASLLVVFSASALGMVFAL